MSSNFRPDTSSTRARLATLVCAASALAALALGAPPLPSAHATGSLRKNAKNRAQRPVPTAPSGFVADDSTAAAMQQLMLIRGVYGGLETWNPMEGVRYDAIYTIPGPEGVPVRSWTESHIVWTKYPLRVRIDNDADSTVVILDADTCWVRRDGVWTSDSSMVANERAAALEARWLVCVPWNLLGETPKRRLEHAFASDSALVVRLEYGPGQDRPAGTIARLTFAPPTFGLRTVHWYDPRSKSWFLLELADERVRFNWRWAELRTLHASDAQGTAGPIVFVARIENVVVASALPSEILAPPGVAR